MIGCRFFFSLFVIVGGASLACSSGGGESDGKAASLQPISAHSEQQGLRYTAPEGWVSETPKSSMRKAQYRLPRVEGDVEDAELVVFYFGGEGGSVQANVERWIGQFQSDSSSNAEPRTRRKESYGIPLTIVDVAGTYTGAGGPMMSAAAPKPNFRMLAAVAETATGPWFFKLTGPKNTVGRWEDSFESFLDSIRP